MTDTSRLFAAATRISRTVWLPGLLTGILAATAVAAPPPANRTYFVIKMGLEGPYSVEGDCLRFSGDVVCTQKERCGTWREIDSSGPERRISFELEFADNDTPFRVEGEARIDDRGTRSSLGAAALLTAPVGRLNFSMAGRSAAGGRCFRLLRELNNEPVMRNPACIQGAEFESPGDSPYMLPYPAGESSVISQAYCFRADSHSDSFAYDFRMPLGSEIVAARSGTVLFVDDSNPDDPEAALTNAIGIEHDDGIETGYGHIQQHSAVVEPGERVVAGQPIARCGDSSSGGLPHLHIEAFRQGASVPIGFSNVDGPLDERGGLMFGYRYTALP